MQYWTGSDWADVTGLREPDGAPVAGVGLHGGGTTRANTVANAVSFDPVSTTLLRLVVTQNRSQVESTGAGIAEWRVFSTDPASVVFTKIDFTDPQWTTRDLSLPSEVDGYTIRWTSSDPRVIDAAGTPIGRCRGTRWGRSR